MSVLSMADLGSSGLRISGEWAYDYAWHIAPAGDFNGDGLGDVLVWLEQGEWTGSVLAVFGRGPEAAFLRGDSNADGEASISDGIHLLSHLFLGGPAPPCTDAADSNDDAKLDITDAVYLLGHLFLGGRPPPAPYPACGKDPAEDALGCAGPVRCP